MSSPALLKLPKVTTLLPPRMVPLLKTSWERISEKPKPEASSSIQLIPVIQRFSTCKFIYLLQFTQNPKPILAALCRHSDTYTAGKDSSHLTLMFLAEVQQGNTLAFLFQLILSTDPFHNLFSARILLLYFLFKMASTQNCLVFLSTRL